MRLASPRRPIQKQPTLEVLASLQQCVAVRSHTERVPLDPREYRLGKHHVLACGRRDLAELERDSAHR
jgi:hypothetical protein